MPFAFPLLVSLIAAAPTPAFVAADVVNLRAEPNGGAPVLAKLRIATPVVIEETRGDWVYLAVSTPVAVAGWALRSFVAEAPPSSAMLREQLRTATPSQRASILQRLVALEPHRAALYGELARAHRAAGRKDAARIVEALAHGHGPTFVAICNAVPNTGVLQVVASYRRGRGWTSWTSLPFEPVPLGEENPPPAPELVRMKLEMAGLAWARVAGSSVEPLPGSPFPSPSAGVFYNGLALELQALSLGACEGGDVFVSAPAIGAKPSATERRALEKELSTRRSGYELTVLAYFRASPGAPLLAVVRFDDHHEPDPHQEDGKSVEEENGFWFLAVTPGGDVDGQWSVTDSGGGC